MLLVNADVIQTIHDYYLNILKNQIEKVNEIMDHFSKCASDIKQLSDY